MITKLILIGAACAAICFAPVTAESANLPDGISIIATNRATATNVSSVTITNAGAVPASISLWNNPSTNLYMVVVRSGNSGVTNVHPIGFLYSMTLNTNCSARFIMPVHLAGLSISNSSASGVSWSTNAP